MILHIKNDKSNKDDKYNFELKKYEFKKGDNVIGLYINDKHVGNF